jgi:hypothetical protein
MYGPHHPLNWYAGWGLVLAAFLSGAALGLAFHRDDFWGGYGSFRRRIVRLGHVALAALGLMNVVYSLSPWPAPGAFDGQAASVCYLVGGIAMPAVCFLTGWKEPCRYLFPIPVAALVLAVLWTLRGAPG